MMESLVEAAREGDLTRVLGLRSEGRQIDERNDTGETALISASSSGHIDVVRYLLAEGADIHASSDKGDTPLIEAAGKGHHQILLLLLAGGANPCVRNKTNHSPLLFAANSGMADAVLTLLRVGGDPNIANDSGITPIIAAANRGAVECVSALFEFGADPNAMDNKGQTPLLAAANCGSVACVSPLLKFGANPNASDNRGQSPLLIAINRGEIECVEILLRAGATIPPESGASILAYAISAPKNSDSVAVKFIEASGVLYGSHNGSSPMSLAIISRRSAIVEALLKVGADPNENINLGGSKLTPLMLAAQSGDIECAAILLKYGADPNLKLGEFTALTVANFSGHMDIVRLLLENNTLICLSDIMLMPELVSGFEIVRPLAADIAEAWRLKKERPEASVDILLDLLIKSAPIQDRIRYLSISMNKDIYKEYPLFVLQLYLHCVQFFNTNLKDATRIVKANHIGIRNRRADEIIAKARCIEELAAIVASKSGHYEDSDEALSMAEFVLSRLPYRQLVDAARSSNLQVAQSRNGVAYEDQCRADLEAGDYLVRKTPVTGDQGADLLVSKADITYAIQCKNYVGAVGNAAVQEAISARSYYGTDHAIVVSNGTFTSSAKELAARTRVILCKREGLVHIDLICSALI